MNGRAAKLLRKLNNHHPSNRRRYLRYEDGSIKLHDCTRESYQKAKKIFKTL